MQSAFDQFREHLGTLPAVLLLSCLYHKTVLMKLTLIIRQGKTQLIGQLKELPGVLTQGRTMAEVKENIHDALALYLDDMREDDSDGNATDIIAREELEFA